MAIAPEKYFRRNPPPAFPLEGSFRHGAVIPAYREEATIRPMLKSLRAARGRFAEPVAVLVVVNYPEGDSPDESLRLREELLRLQQSDPALGFLYCPELKGGVGMARKLGMDCFLAHATASGYAPGEVRIYSLDADVLVEPEYFTLVSVALDQADTVTVGVRHQPGATPQEEAAIRRYERHLDRYAALLRSAGSPYAFHAIGSAFAVTGAGYLRAGGMKVRTAGEDFYFLQEAAKCGPLRELTEVLVHPSARLSDRVPFGTGPALRKITETGELEEIPEAAFCLLAQVLKAASAPGALADDHPLAGAIPPEAERFLEAEHFFTLWADVRRNTPRTDAARLAAFHRWFDGLKTLRFLHYMEKSGS